MKFLLEAFEFCVIVGVPLVIAIHYLRAEPTPTPDPPSLPMEDAAD